jgi:hypothetical protein
LRSTIGPPDAIARTLQYNVIHESLRGGPVVGIQVSRQPLESVPHTVVTRDCKNFLRVDVTRTLDGEVRDLVLEMRTLAGQLSWRKSFGYAGAEVSKSDFAALVRSLEAPTVVRNMRFVGDKKMILDSLRRAKYWPPARDILAGEDGTIWIRQGGSESQGERYWRFSSDGTYDTSIAMPPKLRVFAASRTYIWGVRVEEEADLPRIERYSLR